MFEPVTPSADRWQPQTIRVPREDRSLLCLPDWDAIIAAIPNNADSLGESTVNVQGRTLHHLREWTAREVLRTAAEYTATVTGELADGETALPAGFVVGGHQPSLFHPGVWVKNFAIHELAKQTGRRALNLIVDNDTLTTSSLRVPVGARDNPQRQAIPFDAERLTGPWEDASINDADTFRSFGTRVTRALSDWGIEPMLDRLWPAAVSCLENGGGLRDSLTAARSRVERRWGLRNLELPISRMCELEPFLWFAGHLFAHAERFREIHNAVLNQYRVVNRVRSRTHPVPELTQQDGWTESPFWIWRKGESVRRRAFIRPVGRDVELTDRGDVTVRFRLSPDMDACCAVEALRELPSRGIRLRTRALTTTLFSRLCLADLFVHGIGGAKYDEMTDRIIARFFGLKAPTFAAISATAYLPLAAPFDVTHSDLRRLQHTQRDLRFNSDRVLSPGQNAVVDGLLAEKHELIAAQQAAKTAGLSHQARRARSPVNHERFLRFQQVDRQLAEYTVGEQNAVREEIAAVNAQLAANAVLTNREFSFALYPEATLRPFLTGLFTA